MSTFSKRRNKKNLYTFMVVGLIFFAYFFGLRGIAQDTLRRDESTTLGHIGVMERDGQGLSLVETMDSLLTYSGEHPPLFYLNANLWSDIISSDYRMLRVLPLLWGILALAVIYRISADLSSPQAGLWSIVLLSTFVLYHHFMHEIREYATLLFWASLTWLMYARSISRNRPLTIMQLFGLGAATSGAMYTHPTSIFLFLGIGVYHLLFVPKDKRWWQVSFAVAIGGLTFALWLPGLLSGVDKYGTRFEGGENKILFANDIIEGVLIFWGNGSYVITLGLLALGCFAVLKNERGSRQALLLCIVFLIPYIIFNELFPFTKRLRYLIVLVIPYAVLAGIGIHLLLRSLPKRMMSVILAVLLMMVWIWTGTNFYTTLLFTDAMGTTSPLTFTEYHILMPLLQEITTPSLILVNANYNVSTMKDSKQGGMGIDEYYQSQFDIHSVSIRADSPNNTVSDFVVDFVRNESDFWLNYFYAYKFKQLTDFEEKIATDFKICQEYRYGERSMLVHYVKIDEFDILCIQN